MKLQSYRDKQEKNIAGDRYRPKQISITQTLAEQRLSSPPSVAIKKASAGSSTNVDDHIYNTDGREEETRRSAKPESLASKVRMKRNAVVGNQTSSMETLQERNMSLGSLPMIPEKGDPSLAINDITKNSGMSLKGGGKQGRFTSQYETAGSYPSQLSQEQHERALQLVRASPYAK